MPISSYHDLDVWKASMDLVEAAYAVTAGFPDTEKFGLLVQIRRSAISVPSNLAEGWGRGTRKDYAHFVSMARGSLYELETQIMISCRVQLMSRQEGQDILDRVTAVSKMLRALHSSLTRRNA